MPDCENRIECCGDSPFTYNSGTSNNPDVDPQPDDTDDIIAELSGLRWEIPCGEGSCGSGNCVASDPEDDITELSGSDIEYNVTLRFRGLIEPKDYTGGESGTSGYFQVGGSPVAGPFNLYSLIISDPPKTYYLNRYHVGASPIINSVDYTATIPINGGATVTLHAEVIDGCQKGNGGHVVVPGVPPDPDWYNGQFLQMDVVSIAEA